MVQEGILIGSFNLDRMDVGFLFQSRIPLFLRVRRNGLIFVFPNHFQKDEYEIFHPLAKIIQKMSSKIFPPLTK